MEIYLLFSGLIGFAVGSFLNVAIIRLPQEKSLSGFSYCPKCHKKIAWYDLIPIVSFLLLRAKCRYCKATISWQYPLVELTTGILFSLFTYWYINQPFFTYDVVSWGNLGYFFIVIACFLVFFVLDFLYYFVPDAFMYPLLVSSFIVFPFRVDQPWPNSLLGAGIAFILFYGVYLGTKKKGFGFADVKLVTVLGLLLGFNFILWGLLLSVFIGLIYALILVIMKKKTLKERVPFAPFLVVGCTIIFFLKPYLLSTFSSFFLF